MNSDQNLSRVVEREVKEFHTQLIEAVLSGFVGISATIVVALEGILQSLAKTVSESSSSSDNKTVVCERYEYIPQADVIRSCINPAWWKLQALSDRQADVRIVFFSITESMKNVQSSKKTEKHVKCTIEFNQYEAVFNQKLWKKTSATIAEDELSGSGLRTGSDY